MAGRAVDEWVVVVVIDVTRRVEAINPLAGFQGRAVAVVELVDAFDDVGFYGRSPDGALVHGTAPIWRRRCKRRRRRPKH